MIPVSIIILVILIWCFYFTYQDDVALRQRIIYVEVIDKHKKMERIETKTNLNVMVEKYSKKANNNSLFDKQWYSKRYLQKIEERLQNEPQGLVFDNQGLVTEAS